MIYKSMYIHKKNTLVIWITYNKLDAIYRKITYRLVAKNQQNKKPKFVLKQNIQDFICYTLLNYT